MKTLRMQMGLAILLLVIGLILLTYMVTVEDEPGAIPLLLIGLGIAGTAITRARMRSQRRRTSKGGPA